MLSDVLTLDVEMPRMEGLGVLNMSEKPIYLTMLHYAALRIFACVFVARVGV